MDYIRWLNFKETLKDIAGIIFNVFKWIVFVIFTIIRFIIFIFSSFGLAIFGIVFPFGIYFCFTVVCDLMKGVPLIKTSNYGLFLLFFVVPLILAFVRELCAID